MKKNPLIIGTFILTITGFISRILGFINRIFLSKIFGEEGMGIYQLVAPVMALVFALCAAGIQTSVSKHVAQETGTGNYKHSYHMVFAGLTVSCTLSLICAYIVFTYSIPISTFFLGDIRTAPLLKMLALSFPLSCIHSCINGYYYGIRKTALPALTQLAEQLSRILCILFLYMYCEKNKIQLTLQGLVLGSITGEALAVLISLIAIYNRFHTIEKKFVKTWHPTLHTLPRHIGQILSLGAPLSANRIVINLLAGIETIMIPRSLVKYGLTYSSALSIYGVMTGMVIPLILFPSAITNSVSVLLLPIVSEADVLNRQHTIAKAVRNSIFYCCLLGFTCTFFFFLFGIPIGNLLFSSTLAGKLLMIISFICPFMYINTTLTSVINGLGRTFLTFSFSLTALLIRLIFVIFVIPLFGINAYLMGLLASQLIITVLNVLALRKYILYNSVVS